MTRHRIAYAAVAEQPIGNINIVPLIDVLLVLLIMFIITIPIMTHSVKIDLPSIGPRAAEPETHQFALDSASRITWDGAPVAETALPARLAAFRAAAPDGMLHFRAEPETRYEDFDRVLAAVKRAGVTRLGFVGNDRFARAY
ncbi:MAG: biopolymer transport protein ExbD [Sphingomonadales bacterium]|nr:biopolymer transport protein ExbD [Sphingomonadales bacterium]